MEVVFPLKSRFLSKSRLSQELDKAEWIQKEVESYPSWSNVPKPNDASLRQKGSSYRIPRGGPSVEKYHFYTKGLQRKVDAKLGRTLCRALILAEMDGKNLLNLVNSDSVKKYFT
ncbi:RNA-directed DNA polymerase (Reverse transcriptase), Ribonuclease H [Gossypium australe]|uniref:RNA-directed DNA polymerase (Reverse transcriptase), Ribonuclease H n=1 Tax=Gossypium australe TaxID=47621 RepID=A0A5B6VPU9_9ROSI|nr:RNA-directed DNA polymerase (Reverse transcriptase), Ribonuclease H [Gossypium australe]